MQTEYRGYALRDHYLTTVAATRPDDGIIDEIAVRRRTTGSTTQTVSGRELIACVISLNAQGVFDPDIAERLGLPTAAGVLAIRKRHGIPTPTQPSLVVTRSEVHDDRLPRVLRGVRRFRLGEPLPLIFDPTFGTGTPWHRQIRRKGTAA